jgi:hypothetical protein
MRGPHASSEKWSFEPDPTGVQNGVILGAKLSLHRAQEIAMVIDSRRVITLARRGIVPLQLAPGTSVECTLGCLWLTEDGSQQDIVLEPGDAWQASRAGTVVVSALRESVFSVREAIAQPEPTFALRWRHRFAGTRRPALVPASA